jgi:UDP-glucose 4-epimerase
MPGILPESSRGLSGLDIQVRKRLNAVVTGGCGFIGSHLSELLVNNNHNVTVLDNLSSGNIGNIVDIMKFIRYIKGDIRDEKELIEALTGADTVFHQAAFVSAPQSEKEPMLCYDINIGGTIKLLKTAQKAGVRRVIFASSCAVYGNDSPPPIKENAELCGITPYAKSKILAEAAIEELCLRTSMTGVALRYFNVYGPKQNPQGNYAAVLPKFITDAKNERILNIEGDGRQTRDFVYVEDVARANLLAAESDINGFKVVNVCSGKETSIRQLAEQVQFIMGNCGIRYTEARANDILKSFGSSGRAKELISFSPERIFSEGLMETVKYYDKLS